MKDYVFTYNWKFACSSPGGMKRGKVQANNKTEARQKIKEFLDRCGGTLCDEWF